MSSKTSNMPALATAKLPVSNPVVKPWVEGKPVMVHNYGEGPFTYYFTDGRFITIRPGQSGEIPDNMASIFFRSSNGKVTAEAGSAGAEDVNSKLAIERSRTTELQNQLTAMAAEMAALKEAVKGRQNA